MSATWRCRLAVLFDQTKRLLRRPFMRHTLTAISLILVSLVSILITTTIYRANTGQAVYPRQGHHPELSLPLSCGAQTGVWNLAGPGVAVYEGRAYIVHAIEVTGLLRPKLSTNISTYDMQAGATRPYAGGIARNAIVSTCEDYGRTASLVLLGVYALLALITLIVAHGYSRRWFWRWAVGGLGMLIIVWGLSLGAVYSGSQQVKDVRSLAGVFRYPTLRTAPGPLGPERPQYLLDFEGDSILAGFGNGPKARPSRADTLCGRSRFGMASLVTSDLGSKLGANAPDKVLDTTCAGADILPEGILERELRHGHWIPAQIRLLKAAPNVQDVVADFGPNAAGWGLILGAAERTNANVPPLRDAIPTAIDQMRPAVNDLMSEYHALPHHPRVIIVGTYHLFEVGRSCPASNGFSNGEKALINHGAHLLNQYLRSVAQNNGFVFIAPRLNPLCTPSPSGPDLHGVSSPYFPHPTWIGDVKLATQIESWIRLKPPAAPVG